MNDVCNQHSGFTSDIANLKHDDMLQWKKINQMDKKIDEIRSSIQTRINVILGGVVVACIMLIINIFLK